MFAVMNTDVSTDVEAVMELSAFLEMARQDSDIRVSKYFTYFLQTRDLYIEYAPHNISAVPFKINLHK